MGSHEKDPSSPKRAPPPSRSNSTVSSKHSIARQGSESWEVVDELQIQGGVIQEPERQEGYLLKKRKWPLKGWHKRYFVLEDGILKYATTRQDVLKGKLHGSIDVRLSVMSVNKKAQRVDLDTEDNIYHLKIKSQELFNNWVAKLCSHRQAEKFLMGGHGGRASHPTQTSASTERPRKGKRSTRIWCTQSFAKDDTIGRVGRLHGSVPNLSRYLESCQNQAIFSAPPEYSQLQRSFWILAQKVHGSLSSVLAVLSVERDRLHELQQVLDLQHSTGPSAPGGRGGAFGTSVAGAPLQTLDNPECIRRFHSLSISSDTTLDSFASFNPDEPNNTLLVKGQEQQLSNRSIVSLSDSHTEFFDACEVFLSASSSENEATDDESCISEVTNSISEEMAEVVGGPGRCHKGSAAMHCVGEPSETMLSLPVPLPLYLPGPGPGITRRNCLPASHVHASDVSVWNILRNNIGKDLSKVSMPVQLNEPLNTLQRLCEELEYSALLDSASHTLDPCERLVYMAAFAVSAYASTYYRAGSKPFNPVLGETSNPNKTGGLLSSVLPPKLQVCHHPPISACHAESDNFVFWQDMKWKNKFWGKSLEIIPVGTVNVHLPRHGTGVPGSTRCRAPFSATAARLSTGFLGSGMMDCTVVWPPLASASGGPVRNRLHRGSGQRGKRSYLSSSRGLKNYGFTQFALELNELTPELKRLLPSTDTRLRPDQRYLEEGNVQAAESQKRRIEQLQRDRRRVMEDNNILHQARFFRRQMDANGKESWLSNSTYWKLRAEPGFSNMDSAVLW
ncbi:hypothetical protein JD844_001999 [Phrynosoma platyrhinos]|uniref:PH domain-containing protein n=1 Tax=Phrynosoma platyrhinos TaxID=52577 RepID=A0ABQ7TAN3_PHRPL|nr:hypothetical protein JD844_001999 [Phrynosoma platyrhinos]